MTIPGRSAEQEADDIYRDRIIRTAVYCGRCGYNLRTLPYVHTCPECGGGYNARPLIMHGIYMPHEVELPFADFGLAVFSAGSCVVLLWDAYDPIDWVRAGMGGMMGLFAVVYTRQAFRSLFRALRARSITRRIAIEEADE